MRDVVLNRSPVDWQSWLQSSLDFTVVLIFVNGRKGATVPPTPPTPAAAAAKTFY